MVFSTIFAVSFIAGKLNPLGIPTLEFFFSGVTAWSSFVTYALMRSDL